MKLGHPSLSHRAQTNPYGLALERILARVADAGPSIPMQGGEVVEHDPPQVHPAAE